MSASSTMVEFDHQFLVDLYYDDDAERFTAVIPALPGCVTEAQSLTEARALILEAASIYVESLAEMAAGLPRGFPGPLPGLIPMHSSAIGIREIAQILELAGAPFQGSHVAVSNRANHSVVVFPVDERELTTTTRRLLRHYAGVEIQEFIEAIDRAEQEVVDEDDDIPSFGDPQGP
jgi:predicted RNase H-like HicB family nuclease